MRTISHWHISKTENWHFQFTHGFLKKKSNKCVVHRFYPIINRWDYFPFWICTFFKKHFHCRALSTSVSRWDFTKQMVSGIVWISWIFIQKTMSELKMLIFVFEMRQCIIILTWIYLSFFPNFACNVAYHPFYMIFNLLYSPCLCSKLYRVLKNRVLKYQTHHYK